MMGRTTVYNNIVTDELYAQVNKQNLELASEFVEYLKSLDKSHATIKQYINDLKICFVWNLINNNNKFFVEFNKRDIMRYQNYLVNELKQSSSRVRRLKSAISSMSNFIEAILDEDYPNFRNIVNKIPAPDKNLVREKTVMQDEDVKKLLDYLVEHEKYQQACCFALAIASGARKAELTRFKVSYFKDEHIQYGALYKTPEKIKTKGRSSKGKLLHKYVLVSVFKPYLDLWLKQRKELGIECDDLFVAKTKDGYTVATTFTLDGWTKSFSNILGIDFYLHSARHLFVTNLCKFNVPAEIIKDIVGWNDTSLISVYNDSSVDDEIGKYFDEGGIKNNEKKSLSDL
jgi:integrase